MRRRHIRGASSGTDFGRAAVPGVLAPFGPVGGACRVNPIPVLLPCHRVVGSSGIGGFAARTAGRLVAIKGWLLAHEQGGA